MHHRLSFLTHMDMQLFRFLEDLPSGILMQKRHRPKDTFHQNSRMEAVI